MLGRDFHILMRNDFVSPLRRGFHTLIRNVSFPFLIDVGSHNPPLLGASVIQSMWNLTIYLSWGPESQLAHCPVSGFDTICNSPSLLLAYIIYFGSLRIAVSLTVLKCICWGETYTPFVLLSNQCEISYDNERIRYVRWKSDPTNECFM